MAMSATNLYIPQDMTQESDDLGCLAFYTVRNAEPTRDEIYRALHNAGLDADLYTPKRIFAADAFRRATSSVEAGRLPLNNDPTDERKVNIMVREVLRDKEKIVRHLVREVVDAANQRLEYQEVAALTLDRQNEFFIAQRYTSLLDPEEVAIRQARERYEHQLEHYDSNAVRQIVLQIVRSCMPVTVRPSGGVYFLRREHLDTVKRLSSFLQSISKDSHFWYIPVADDEERRKMVQASVDEQVETEGQRIIALFDRFIKNGEEIPEAVLQTAMEETRQLERLTAEYEELLAQRLDGARATLELTRQRMQALWALA